MLLDPSPLLLYAAFAHKKRTPSCPTSFADVFYYSPSSPLYIYVLIGNSLPNGLFPTATIIPRPFCYGSKGEDRAFTKSYLTTYSILTKDICKQFAHIANGAIYIGTTPKTTLLLFAVAGGRKPLHHHSPVWWKHTYFC